jgi:hypothetical protein
MRGGHTMARPAAPTIPDDKVIFYREQLYRELSHMFEWTGLPTTVPQDYLERNLVRHGFVLYYEDESIGQDVLRCTVTGFNRHELPVQARTYSPNTTTTENTTISRNIKRLADHKDIVNMFNPTTDGVLICNMAYGQNLAQIVDHYAERLALAQQAFDTNLLWANIPYIFQTASDETRLSIERMFSKIFKGEPFIIADKDLFADNKDRTGVPTGINYIGKELMDTLNEIMMKFRETVGFNTAGVDKAERVNTLEIKSNDQHTQSVLQIMLRQRQIAAEAIKAFFGQNITVNIITPPEQEYTGEGVEMDEDEDEEGEDFGANNS